MKPINWPEFGFDVPTVDIVAVFLTSSRAYNLKITMSSFFSKNSYPLKKVVCVNDGPSYPELEAVIKLFPNVTWVISNIKVGQLEAVDQGFRYIDTEYFFFSEDDFEYLKPGFIEHSLQALIYDPKMNAMTMGYSGYDWPQAKPAWEMGPLKVITPLHMPSYAGFSFWPTTRRWKQY